MLWYTVHSVVYTCDLILARIWLLGLCSFINWVLQIDRAWEPRIPSPCSLKAITHAIGSKIGSSRSRWNRSTKYYPVGMKTHIEYHDIFFWKYNSPYHIEMGTYVLIDLLWAGGAVAPGQPTSLQSNWGIFAQTCSTCLEVPNSKDSYGTHPCRAIDRAWVVRIPSQRSLKAITHATVSKKGSSRSFWNRGTEYYPVGTKTHFFLMQHVMQGWRVGIREWVSRY